MIPPLRLWHGLAWRGAWLESVTCHILDPDFLFLLRFFVFFVDLLEMKGRGWDLDGDFLDWDTFFFLTATATATAITLLGHFALFEHMDATLS